MADLSIDVALYQAYCDSRRQFLRHMGCDDSCRDPLAEFAERVVHQQVGGTLAASRVQKGYDLVSPSGRRIQVKYLANPVGKWRNEHRIEFSESPDDYALLILEGFDISALLIFCRETLASVCEALGKRHPEQERVLQFTQSNFKQIIGRVEEFERFGVRTFLPKKGCS